MTQKRTGATVLAGFGYDFGPNGIGRRITATVPGLATDTVGYDPSPGSGQAARSRVLTQTRAILGIGAGTYTTRLRYDGADRPLTTTLPTGEVITQAFNAVKAELRSPKSADLKSPVSAGRKVR